MSVWEYRVTTGNGEMNAMGQQGWELVAALPQFKMDGQYTQQLAPCLYWKRKWVRGA